MRDPLGGFESVKESLALYIRTAFRTRYPGFEAERRELLDAPEILAQEPWIEPMPRYQSSGKKIFDLDADDLPGLDEKARNAFRNLAAAGLVGEFALYSHQAEMLRRATAGENLVITAGTGSGKTEAFLLPLFASLAAESRSWDPPLTRPSHADDWWSSRDFLEECTDVRTVNTKKGPREQRSWNRSPRVEQRGHEERRAGIRALVLYPMNALVEDQLSRLRRALDSPAARDWWEQACNGNRIYFGRYNGATPGLGHEMTPAGNPDKGRIDPLIRQLQKADAAAAMAAEHVEEHPGSPVADFFPAGLTPS